MNPRELGRDHRPFRHRITNPTTERIHHVFLRMSISWEVEPFCPLALPAVTSKRFLHPNTSRVNCQVASVKQQFDHVEPVQHLVLRPPRQ